MKKSAAFQKIDAQRDAMNGGAEKLQAEDLSSTVYLYENADRPCARLYRGRALKPSGSYYYRSTEERATRVADWMHQQAGRAVARKPAMRGLVVGDVLRSSWGYEQSNIDYYLVTKMIGKASVEIVEIGKISKYDAQDRGYCVPDVSRIIGEPMRKKVDGTTVKINTCSWARKMEPKTLPGGVKVYESSYWSSYA